MTSETDAVDITVEDLAAWRRDGTQVTVLDVREPWEVSICSLEDSLKVPMQQVPAHAGNLPDDQPIVVICHSGLRSDHVARWLRGQGLTNAVNLAGGIDAWAERIDPSMARY